MAVYRFLQKIIYYVSAVFFGGAAALALICVIFRYVLNNSIVWGEEAIRLMFIWMFMFAGAEAFRREKHLTLDIFLTLWPKPAQRICKIIIDIILICFLMLFAYLGTKTCLNNIGQKTVALGLSYGIAYMAMPLGVVLMTFFVIHNLIKRIKNKESAGG